MKKTAKKIKTGDITLTQEGLDAIAESSEEIKNENNCEFHLIMHFNGKKFECFTNNIKVSMLSFRPDQLFTEGYVRIEKGTANFERKYNLIDLKKLMNDEQRLDLFVNNLILG